MSSTIGNIIRTTVFGESHGPAIGAVMDAPPAGYKISYGELAVQMKRRAPGTDPTATARREADDHRRSARTYNKERRSPLKQLRRNKGTPETVACRLRGVGPL